MLILMKDLNIRVGNEIYLEENDSVGLCTMSKSHFKKDTLVFKGKKGILHEKLLNKSHVNFINKILGIPGKTLFKYYDSDSSTPKKITASDINNFLKINVDENMTCKDIRTYSANNIFNKEYNKLLKSGLNENKARIEAIKYTANELGNTTQKYVEILILILLYMRNYFVQSNNNKYFIKIMLNKKFIIIVLILIIFIILLEFHADYKLINNVPNFKKGTLFICSHNYEHKDIFITFKQFSKINNKFLMLFADKSWNYLLESFRPKNIEFIYVQNNTVNKLSSKLLLGFNIIMFLYNQSDSSGPFYILQNTKCPLILVKIKDLSTKKITNHYNSNINNIFIDNLLNYYSMQFKKMKYNISKLTNKQTFLNQLKYNLYK